MVACVDERGEQLRVSEPGLGGGRRFNRRIRARRRVAEHGNVLVRAGGAGVVCVRVAAHAADVRGDLAAIAGSSNLALGLAVTNRGSTVLGQQIRPDDVWELAELPA